MAEGLIAVGVADALAREGSKWAERLFWAGMALLWVPPVVRIIGCEASRENALPFSCCSAWRCMR
jgi:hypothetical protein